MSHAIEGHKQSIINNVQRVEHLSCKTKSCHMMITSIMTNVNSNFQLAGKFDSKLNQ
jgi:predicted transcriptional regulator